VQGAVPTTSQLELGELAINTYDGKLFLKRDDGLAQYIVEVGGNIGFEVKNQTGSTISKGTVVKFAGTLGASGRLLVAPFLANGTDPSEYVVGIVENDIPNGADGFAIDHGKIFNLNTSAFSQGAILYASSTIAGGLTATRPAAPNNKVTVAAVIHSSTTVGILEVRVTIGSSIENDELVEIGTLADGDTLVWNATNGRFENEQPSGGGSSVVVSGTAPSSPENGDLWFNSSDGSLSVYYIDVDGGQWVSTGGAIGPEGPPGPRIPLVSSTASITSPLAWNSDNFDQYVATAQASALTINADSGTPVDGQKMLFRFKDDGTARGLTWTTGTTKSFRAVGVTLPTTTIINKTLYVGCIYNAADSRWDVIATGQEA
jgi:hypothetical protein